MFNKQMNYERSDAQSQRLKLSELTRCELAHERKHKLFCFKSWRKRVGVEPTIPPAKGGIAEFEVREDHRTPCASARIMERVVPRFNLLPNQPAAMRT